MTVGSLTESLQETFDIFAGSCVPRTTNEVAELLDLGRRSTYDRLDRLVDHGLLETKKVGASARVWWRPIAQPSAQSAEASTLDGSAESGSDQPQVDTVGVPISTMLDNAEVGVFVLDADLRVAWINDAIERYFGLDRAEVLGRDKRELVDGTIRHAIDDSETFVETVLATYDDNTYTEEFECHVTSGARRDERWLEHRSTPIDSGSYAGGRVEVYYDITDRKRTGQRLEAEHERFRSLVKAVDEYAIFMLDTEGRIQTWNEGATRLKGYEPEGILGEHFSIFYTESDREAGVPAENLANARQNGVFECEGWRLSKDGTEFWAHATITAIHDEDGDLQGYVKVTRDMTDRREREREIRAERNLLEQILETSPIGLGVFHPDGSLDRMNARMEELLGVTSSEANEYTLGDRELLGPDGEPLPLEERPAVEAIETGEPVIDREIQIEYPGRGTRWYTVNAAPLKDNDGDIQRVVTASMDITRRKEQARRLERQRDDLKDELDDVFDRVSDGFLGLDDDWQITYLNDHAEDLLGREEGAVLGRNVWDVFPDALDRTYRDRYERAMETQEPVVFEEYSTSAGAWLEVAAYPSETGLSIYFRDISERKERERALEESEQRYRTIVENFPNGGVGLFDRDLQYTLIGGEILDRLDADAEDLIGTHVGETLGADAAEAQELLEEPYRAAFRGEQSSFEASLLDRTYAFRILPVTDESGDVFAGLVISQDITERKERERKLEESERRYRTLVDNFPNGAVALIDEDLRYLVIGGKEFDGLDVSVEDIEGQLLTEALPADLVETLEPEYRATFEGESREFEIEFDGRIRQFHTVPMYDDDEVYAIMGMSQDITQRREYARELEHQREQLAALDNVNTIFREITDAVIEQSTREEIEEIVVERLAAADSYSFAWFSEVDPRTQSVEPTVEAGVDGYLEEIALTVNPDDPVGRGPTGKAVQTQEIQVARNVFEDPDFEPWREAAEEYGYRSSAAVPITHEGSIYGVLGIYTDRELAFAEDERAVIGQLGEVIGHAIAAVERKRALMSDEVVELEFQMRNLVDAIDVSVDAEGTVDLEQAVPIGDGNFLEYGTATGDAMKIVEAIVAGDALPHWESVSVLEESDDETRFELKLTDPPILSAVASHGGNVQTARFEGGDFYLQIHLPPGADVRQVVEVITDAYPAMEMVTQRQVTRDRQSSTSFSSVLFEELTDRQRAALEAAYHAGYFGWPRDTTGEAVAASMAVSPSTFHQHLRKAQRKLLAAALDEQRA